MLALSENPPAVWPEDAALDDAAFGASALPLGASDASFRADGAARDRWWVGHTKARFEKAFAFDLLARRVPYFLPMVQRVRVSGGRKRRVMAPLFGGYVFFRGTREDRYRALATDRLCQVIEVADQARLARELAALHRAIIGGAPLDPYPFAAVGRRCRVTAGPFRGLEGVVVRRELRTAGTVGGARLVLEVAMLGQGAAMEIDADLLEPASDEMPGRGVARPPVYSRSA